MADQPQPDMRMQKQVLNYFLRNPLAADTLEGVARWRLLDEFVRATVEETHATLQWLVGRGFLSTSAASGAEATFRLNAARSSEARQFLNGLTPRATKEFTPADFALQRGTEP